VEWQKDVSYHSTLSEVGVYSIYIGIGSYYARHEEQKDIYDGWMALGASGGFIYFSVILHTIIMIIVGVRLENDSAFLQGPDSDDISNASKPILQQS